MTITYPRSFPGYAIGAFKLLLERNDLLTPDGGGTLSGLQFGFPMWRLEFDAEMLTDFQSVGWQSFLDSLDGAANGVMGHDFRRMYPAAFSTGTFPGGFGGSASSFSLDGTLTVVTLNGLSALNGYTLSPGDMVGFKGGSGNLKRSMHRIVEGATIGSGTVAVRVRPAVYPIVSGWSSVVAHLDQPAAVFKLDPSSQIGDSEPFGRTTSRIVFRQYYPA